MNDDDFSKLVKKLVSDYSNDNNTPANWIRPQDVRTVWQCKTLQNSKAIASTVLPDHRLYEVTYDGDKRCVYLDAYTKVENKKIILGTNNEPLN